MKTLLLVLNLIQKSQHDQIVLPVRHPVSSSRWICSGIGMHGQEKMRGTEREAPAPALGICHVHERYFTPSGTSARLKITRWYDISRPTPRVSLSVPLFSPGTAYFVFVVEMRNRTESDREYYTHPVTKNYNWSLAVECEGITNKRVKQACGESLSLL